MFNDSIKNSLTSSFDSWTTDRKVFDTGLEFQFDNVSAQKVNSPKYLIAAHQSIERIGVPSKLQNISSFHKNDVRDHFCDIEGFRYPTDSVNIN